MTIGQAARLLGTDPSKAAAAFAELLANQVAHQDPDGTIFCPRLIRDFEKAMRTREARSKGGTHGHMGREFGVRGGEVGKKFGRGHRSPRADASPLLDGKHLVDDHTDCQPPLTAPQTNDENPFPIDPGEVFTAWNAVAAEAGFEQAVQLTNARRTTILARARDPFWLENWRVALDRITKSTFCCGSKGWKARLDWFLRPDTVMKILEHDYDDRQLPADVVIPKPLTNYYAKQTAKAMED
jgi:hypothetical protein